LFERAWIVGRALHAVRTHDRVGPRPPLANRTSHSQRLPIKQTKNKPSCCVVVFIFFPTIILFALFSDLDLLAFFACLHRGLLVPFIRYHFASPLAVRPNQCENRWDLNQCAPLFLTISLCFAVVENTVSVSSYRT